jgi:two-component system, OmpR family, sensor histidine kinase BaeS
VTLATRRRSLFWTFAGVFLLVLVAASVLQAVVGVAVLRPLAAMSVRDRAELAVLRAARELAASPGRLDGPQVVRVLRANHIEGAPVVLVFRDDVGRMATEPPLPPGMQGNIVELLTGRPLTHSPLAFARPSGPGGSGPPPGEGPAPPEPGQAPPGGAGAHPRGPREPRMEILGRRSVTRDGSVIGEVAAVGAPLRQGFGSLPEPRALLLFVPFAMLAAGAAGLLMVRILVRRLRALELFAARVTEGDLAARVEAHGLDEIGRLEERFNRMTERLAAARDELDRADVQRRRLLADITHELSTPLTSIRGYVETLLDPAVPTSADERAGYLHDVLDEAKRLDLLISDLFDLVRLEAGASPLVQVQLDWASLCRNTARRFEPRFRESGLTLRWAGEPDEAWVRADGRRMEQVVENLLVNALRYVPAGGTVVLALERVDLEAGGRFRLTLSDDGPGVDAADLPHIFERFYRADAVRGLGGSGLGLAIVREIVLRHGGEVRATRLEPRGMVFVVELPALVA